MAGRKIYGASDMNVVLQTQKLIPCSSEVLPPLWIPTSSSSFRGSNSMVNFENASGVDSLDNGDDDYDPSLHQPGKKRRLKLDQVQFLEKHFEAEIKLEPERKVELAKELGLQPRQVAIWFQNRRARYKTKQLEKEYDTLKASYEKLKVDHDNLLKKNGNLKNEIDSLKDILPSREKAKPGQVILEQQNALHSSDFEPEDAVPNAGSENVTSLPVVVCKQEDASSAKSDVFDSDSPHCTENYSSFLEPAATDSSNVFEPADHSDFSQDEDDSLSKTLLPTPYLLKLEECCYDDLPRLPPCSGNLGFSLEDPPSFCFWPY